ncbi:MAG: transposase [Actinomycetia bacterium]|nr:transposase [Actinomycetes bacterium]
MDLLGRLVAPVASFRADGAYDTRAVYAALDEVCAEQIDIAIPPRQTAASSRPGVGTWRHREAALRRIDAVGRRRWRKESGANQQARAENGMYRFKQVLGPRLRSRSEEGQRKEAMIGVNILNRMTEFGMPESVAVRS